MIQGREYEKRKTDAVIGQKRWPNATSTCLQQPVSELEILALILYFTYTYNAIQSHTTPVDMVYGQQMTLQK
jgi:hypothetical protein